LLKRSFKGSCKCFGAVKPCLKRDINDPQFFVKSESERCAFQSRELNEPRYTDTDTSLEYTMKMEFRKSSDIAQTVQRQLTVQILKDILTYPAYLLIVCIDWLVIHRLTSLRQVRAMLPAPVEPFLIEIAKLRQGR